MSDPLVFSWQSTPALWACYYDPEGPSGYGKTKERALEDLIHQCDDEHTIKLLAGAIWTMLPPPTDCGGWKLVPREVTPEMQHAYFDVIDKNMERVSTDAMFGRYASAKEAYRAMIDAAPETPARWGSPEALEAALKPLPPDVAGALDQCSKPQPGCTTPKGD